jgi:hypothetical protein
MTRISEVGQPVPLNHKESLLTPSEKPSLFELFAVDQLNELLRPAIGYVMGLFSRKYLNQRQLQHVHDHFDLYYMIVWLAIEYRHFDYFGGF